MHGPRRVLAEAVLWGTLLRAQCSVQEVVEYSPPAERKCDMVQKGKKEGAEHRACVRVVQAARGACQIATSLPAKFTLAVSYEWEVQRQLLVLLPVDPSALCGNKCG